MTSDTIETNLCMGKSLLPLDDMAMTSNMPFCPYFLWFMEIKCLTE